jgi:hypothetical protein
MYQDLMNFSRHEIVRRATDLEVKQIEAEFKRICAMHNSRVDSDDRMSVSDLITEYCGTSIGVDDQEFLVTMNKYDAHPYAPLDNIEYYLIKH